MCMAASTDGARPLYDLTGFQRDALAAIARLGDPKGLAVKDELEAYYEGSVQHGRLYPNLNTLVEKALVEKGQKDNRTNWYRLTDRGRRELKANAAFQNPGEW